MIGLEVYELHSWGQTWDYTPATLSKDARRIGMTMSLYCADKVKSTRSAHGYIKEKK
jgi:hypothetical protein